MARTIVVTGGNSGIGLEAARQLGAQGHRLILLGRDATKGAAAVEAVKQAGGAAEFHAVDLSIHDGVKAAAEKLSGLPKVDGIIHAAGWLMVREQRTPDGLHPVFAVNYLSRYHLTQRLLPQLRASGEATVVLIVAGVPLDTKIDFERWPKFDPFPGMRALPQTQIANHHYVSHLAKNEPTLRAAAANVGLVKTEIMRDMPGIFRFGFTVFGPLVTIPVSRAAANPAWLSTDSTWKSGGYWAKPGRKDLVTPLQLDAEQTKKIVDSSRTLTGA